MLTLFYHFLYHFLLKIFVNFLLLLLFLQNRKYFIFLKLIKSTYIWYLVIVKLLI